MTNPFEIEDGKYFVLRNDEGQYSLWPDFVAVPAGWSIQFGPDAKPRCLDFVNENWTDMRPKSLIEATRQH